ncbi:fructose-1,6-bisphosphate aldolase [Natrarchaeobius halalkaliphilus]|uniref:fructose-bisphosphate aldolase n=1 Tax=Natrarchaeobius halalkaliphilus TaxID=1679091 RepID=A0A3N6P3X9_9EURY|nr:fructose-1,6-bisphosphate aldolase [Natrarchaeobius halalkaliphilus]RQG90065.1 fructose-1,6-bisphosphate aldolase [Natrarchaeobius halalkaliphilus]
MLPTSTGNAVIVAIDHGLSHGRLERFEDPEATLQTVLEGNPDGILAGIPFLRRFDSLLSEHPDLVTVGTVDQPVDSTLPGDRENAEIHHQAFSVEEAARVGVDAIKTALVFGREDPDVLANNLQLISEVSETARAYGIDSVVEPTLWGQRAEDELDAEYLAHANRIGFEIGADILKSPYTGDPESFAPIAEDAPVPMYIAGGPAQDDDAAVLEMVRSGMDAGIHGVMFGRTIWKHDDPAGMIAAIKSIVHEDASVQDAADHLH